MIPIQASSPYPTHDRLLYQQIGWSFLLALAMHLVVVVVMYFRPAEMLPFAKQPIEVSLASAPPSESPVFEKRPTPPKPEPQPERVEPPTPATEAAPKVAQEPPPATAAPATPNIQTQQTEEIQPLFRLTRMPSFSRKIETIYPAAERRAGIQASVLAEVTIDAQGNVQSVRILKSGGSAFDEAVKVALQKSLFNPGMIEGKAVGTRFQVPFRFNLN